MHLAQSVWFSFYETIYLLQILVQKNISCTMVSLVKQFSMVRQPAMRCADALMGPSVRHMASKVPEKPKAGDKSYAQLTDCYEKGRGCNERADDTMDPLKNRRSAQDGHKTCLPRDPKPFKPKPCPPEPQAPRRPRRQQKTPGAVCKSSGDDDAPPLKLMEDAQACKKVMSLFCPPSRDPPSCKSNRAEQPDCTRIATPYPSFVECKKAATLPLPPTECRCMERLAPWKMERKIVADR